jgi:hypothetical protein
MKKAQLKNLFCQACYTRIKKEASFLHNNHLYCLKHYQKLVLGKEANK